MRYPHQLQIALAVITASSLPALAVEPRDIGNAVEIQREVSAAQEQQERRRLAKQDPVRELEVVETGRASRGEFILADDTKLAIGPQGRITLDKFVYDPDKNTGQVTINFTKGAFRFISGKSGKENYEIKTPRVSLGIRGTVFDGYIADNGAAVFLLHEGAVNVCTRRCHTHNKRRRLVYVTRNGRIIPRNKWDPSLMRGVRLRTAYPFL